MGFRTPDYHTWNRSDLKQELREWEHEHRQAEKQGTDMIGIAWDHIKAIKKAMGYGNRNYNNNYNNNYGNRGGYNRKPPAKSGAKVGIQSKGINEGKLYVSAWKANKRHGMVSIIGFENQRSVESKSRTGNKFVTIMFEITFKDTGNQMLELGNYCKTTGKVFLEKLGWVISTKGANGGYCGPIKNG